MFFLILIYIYLRGICKFQIWISISIKGSTHFLFSFYLKIYIKRRIQLSYSEFSFQILGNDSKEASFFCSSETSHFYGSIFYHSISYNHKKLSSYKPVKNKLVSYKKVAILLDTFSGGFFLKPKLKKSDPCFFCPLKP